MSTWDVGGFSYLPSQGPVLNEGEAVIASYPSVLLYASSGTEPGDVHLTSFKVVWISHREKAEQYGVVESTHGAAPARKHLMVPIRNVLYAEKDWSSYFRIRLKAGGLITTHWKKDMGNFLDLLSEQMHGPHIFSGFSFWATLAPRYPDKVEHHTCVMKDARRLCGSVWGLMDNGVIHPPMCLSSVPNVCADINALPPRVCWVSTRLAVIRSGFPSDSRYSIDYHAGAMKCLGNPESRSLFVHLCNRTRVGCCNKHVGLIRSTEFLQWPLLSPAGLARAYLELDSQTFPTGKESKWTKNLWRVSTLLHDLILLAMSEDGKTSKIFWITSWAGSDRAIVVTSLLEICLDSVYRTHAGFQLLVEKEWLQGGHPFSSRLGHLVDARTAPAPGSRAHRSQISPVFVLFVDVVRLLVRQCPQCFEFNELFLLHLVDVAYSGKTATFTRTEGPSAWSYLQDSHLHAAHTNPTYDAAIVRPILMEKHIPPTIWHELMCRYWHHSTPHTLISRDTTAPTRVDLRPPPKNPLRNIVEITEPIYFQQVAQGGGDGLTLSYVDLVKTPEPRSRVVYFGTPATPPARYLHSVD